jgi:hypothetical protein
VFLKDLKIWFYFIYEGIKDFQRYVILSKPKFRTESKKTKLIVKFWASFKKDCPNGRLTEQVNFQPFHKVRLKLILILIN